MPFALNSDLTRTFITTELIADLNLLESGKLYAYSNTALNIPIDSYGFVYQYQFSEDWYIQEATTTDCIKFIRSNINKMGWSDWKSY